MAASHQRTTKALIWKRKLDVTHPIQSIGRIAGEIIVHDDFPSSLDVALAAAIAEVDAQKRKVDTMPTGDAAACATETQLLRALKMKVAELRKRKQDAGA